MKIVALIGAKSGSKRLPDKNIKMLHGHPLMAYTIKTALQSNIFDNVVVSSDSSHYLEIASQYGATPFKCPKKIAHKELDADIKWIRHAIVCILQKFDTNEPMSSNEMWIKDAVAHLKKHYTEPDCFAILRCTNPFRQVKTIIRAWNEFQSESYVDSIRAIRTCKEHPYKMWIKKPFRFRERLYPLVQDNDGLYNYPYQALPTIFIQSGALEIGKVSNILNYDNVSGKIIKPFYMPTEESFDINTPDDFYFAEYLLDKGLIRLPEI